MHSYPVGARSPALCLQLPLAPYLVWANSKGFRETAQMHRLAWAFAVRPCDKYPFHMGWLKWSYMWSFCVILAFLLLNFFGANANTCLKRCLKPKKNGAEAMFKQWNPFWTRGIHVLFEHGSNLKILKVCRDWLKWIYTTLCYHPRICILS